MTQNPERKILQHLSDAVSRLTPDSARELWERPAEPADSTAWYLDTKPGRSGASGKRYYLGAVAACLVLCLLASIVFPMMPSAAVYLDVNPGISLSVNYRNRITGVKACNADGEKVIGDLDFRGADLDVALYAILGSMVQNGYLTEDRDTILVSVRCANAGRAGKLENEVSDVVTASLKNMINAGEVLSHQVDKEEASENQPFTPGKASFIQKLREKYPQLDEDDLEDLSMDDIVTLLKQEHLDYSDYTDDDFDDDDEDDLDDADDNDDDDDDLDDD